MPRGLLVGYSGYPYTPNSLTPDNTLANLAGALLKAGHQAYIIDYGTVSTMRRLFPKQLHEIVKPMAAEMIKCDAPPDSESMDKLLQLAAKLESHQEHEQAVIAQELAAQVSRLQVNFVLFVVWDGDGFTGSVALAERLKTHFPSLHIYATGPQARRFHEYFYRRSDVFDAVIYGEAEAIVELVAEHATGKRKLQTIPGIVYKDGADVKKVPQGEFLDLNDLPAPVYDEQIYPAMAGDEKIKVIALDDSRGCPHCCYFCTHPIEEGNRLRTASPTLLVDRMEQMINHHGIRAFRFFGSSTPGSLLYSVAQEIIQRNLDLQYISFGHYGTSEPQQFDVMAKSGLFSIFFGLESGCKQILESSVGRIKANNLHKAKPINAAAQASGIYTVASIIVPLPFDTDQTLRESLDFLVDMSPDSVTIQFPGLLPGTPWIEDMERFGFEADPEQIMLEGLDYKLKLMFPPQYWQEPPYTMNGMSFHQYALITGKFAASLEAHGILTGLSHYNALIASCAAIPPHQYRDMARLWCLSGDADAMGQLVSKANEHITRRPG